MAVGVKLVLVGCVVSGLACAAAGGAGGGASDTRDSFRRPTEHGVPVFDEIQVAEISPDARFHAWDFHVYGQADISVITQPADWGNPAPLDTVIYLYRRSAEGTWGRYIEMNDDTYESDSVPWSELSATIDAGDYRALVKSKGPHDRGEFSFWIVCDGVCEDPNPTSCASLNTQLDDCVIPGETYPENCAPSYSDPRFARAHECCRASELSSHWCSWLRPETPPPAFRRAFEEQLDGVVKLARREIVPTFEDSSIQEVRIEGYSAPIESAEEVRSLVYEIMLREQYGYVVAEGEVEQAVAFDGTLHHDYDEYLPGSVVETALPTVLAALGAGPWEAVVYSFTNGSDTGENGTFLFSVADDAIVRVGYWESR